MTKRKKIFLVLFVLLILFDIQVWAQETTKKILWTVDWSPDENFIAVGGNADTLKIYRSENLQLYKTYPIRNTITCVKWHPYKNILGVGTQTSGDKVRILNFETDKTLELDGISMDGARGIDWNFSGEFLAVADNDGQISIFDKDGHIIRKIKHENSKSITGIDWHPSKNIFVTVGDKIRIFNIDGGLLKTIKHRKEETLLLCVAWHQSGDFFVTGDYGDHQNKYKPLLQFWSETGELIKSNSVSKSEYRNVSWNNKGNRLATASDALRVWDKKGNIMYEGKSEDYLWGVSWNRKGDRIVTSDKEQKVIIWDNKARKKMTAE